MLTRFRQCVTSISLATALLGATVVHAQSRTGASPTTAPTTSPTTAPAAGAGPATAEAAAHAQAQLCADAFVRSDFNVALSYMDPAVVTTAGGAEKMNKLLAETMADMKANAVTFQSSIVSPPTQMSSIGAHHFAILPQRLTMSLPTGTLTQDGYLLGHSTDGGQTWKFVDGSGLNAETLPMLFPVTPPDLRLPPKRKPTLVPKS